MAATYVQVSPLGGQEIKVRLMPPFTLPHHTNADVLAQGFPNPGDGRKPSRLTKSIFSPSVASTSSAGQWEVVRQRDYGVFYRRRRQLRQGPRPGSECSSCYFLYPWREQHHGGLHPAEVQCPEEGDLFGEETYVHLANEEERRIRP